MSEALAYLYYIFDKFINLIFNQLEISSNVTIGWIGISIIIFAMMIKTILNIPRGLRAESKSYMERNLKRRKGN